MAARETLKTVAIVQARMGSSRLPGKVLRELCGEPMLARVLGRLQRAQRLDAIWVATSTLDSDAVIADFCAAREQPCFRGSENDVLDRYWQTAQAAGAEAIVRITADCPLIDPGLVDEVCAAFVAGRPALDYVSNGLPRRTFPRGLDTEVFSWEALDTCHSEAISPSHREHVTAFIYQHPERFRCDGVLAGDGDWSDLRWTVDTPEDFAVVTAVFEHFGHGQFTWREALTAAQEHPAWSELNRQIEQKKI